MRTGRRLDHRERRKTGDIARTRAGAGYRDVVTADASGQRHRITSECEVAAQ